MHVCDENLGDPADTECRLVELMLCRFAGVEEPEFAIESEGERGMVSGARGHGGAGTEECDADRVDGHIEVPLDLFCVVVCRCGCVSFALPFEISEELPTHVN